MGRQELPGSLQRGKERLVLKQAPIAAGAETVSLGIDADSVIVSLYVLTVSGTLDVKVRTIGGDGSLEVISFPTISSPTTDLVIKKAAVILDRIEVTATYSAACDYEVRVRGISTGETSVKILGASSATATKQTVTTTAGLLIPAAFTDRAGLIVKNYSSSSVLFIGFTLAEAVATDGYPIGAGESLGIDVAAGQEIYAVASSGTIDTRIMEAGG